MKIKNKLTLFIAGCLLAFSTVFVVALPLSCRLTEEGLTVVEGEETVPKIASYSVESESVISLYFTSSVHLEKIGVKDDLGNEFAGKTFYLDDGRKISYELENAIEAGEKYFLDGVAVDTKGNSLEFSLPFVGFNQNPARLVLGEIRSEYVSSSKKIEFVELVVLKGGNLAGLEIVTGSDGEEKKFVFPKINVARGDFLTVHFRTLEEETSINELEDNILISKSTDSCDTARDFWVSGTESRISKSDVIVLRDSCRDFIMDAVVFSESGKTSWYKAFQKNLALASFEKGVWLGGDSPEYAAVSDGATATRTLCRLNLDEIFKNWQEENVTPETIIPSSSSEWAVVVKCTPGYENELTLYEK